MYHTVCTCSIFFSTWLWLKALLLWHGCRPGVHYLNLLCSSECTRCKRAVLTGLTFGVCWGKPKYICPGTYIIHHVHWGRYSFYKLSLSFQACGAWISNLTIKYSLYKTERDGTPQKQSKCYETLNYINVFPMMICSCCGAGTAADTEMTTQLISSNLELHSLSTGREARVVTANRMLKQKLFR